MKLQVTHINVEFSRGSFEEWANNMEEHPESDVLRWETAYNQQIADAIQDVYPYAEIEVGEGYDQMMNTKYHIDLEVVEENADYEDPAADETIYGMMIEDEVKQTIEHILDQVANDGSFWEA